MYSDYSDDDDYDHDQFNEDDLNDEEYNLLHDMLPAFRDLVAQKHYSIDLPLLKEYLWESNFHLDTAMEFVTENHKRMYAFFNFSLSYSPFLSSFPLF